MALCVSCNCNDSFTHTDLALGKYPAPTKKGKKNPSVSEAQPESHASVAANFLLLNASHSCKHPESNAQAPRLAEGKWQRGKSVKLQGPWPLFRAWKEICTSPDTLKINPSVWSPFTHPGDSKGVITWAWRWEDTWKLSVNLCSTVQRETVTKAACVITPGDDLSPRYERAGRTGPHEDGHQLNIPVNSNEPTPKLIRWTCCSVIQCPPLIAPSGNGGKCKEEAALICSQREEESTVLRQVPWL